LFCVVHLSALDPFFPRFCLPGDLACSVKVSSCVRLNPSLPPDFILPPSISAVFWPRVCVPDPVFRAVFDYRGKSRSFLPFPARTGSAISCSPRDLELSAPVRCRFPLRFVPVESRFLPTDFCSLPRFVPVLSCVGRHRSGLGSRSRQQCQDRVFPVGSSVQKFAEWKRSEAAKFIFCINFLINSINFSINSADFLNPNQQSSPGSRPFSLRPVRPLRLELRFSSARQLPGRGLGSR
jgi:hypothetical protein